MTTRMVSPRALEEFHIASQAARFKILGYLSVADQGTIEGLRVQIKIRRAAIWQHLIVLQKVGMVKSRGEKGGTRRYYEITRKGQEVLNKIRIPLTYVRKETNPLP